MSVMIGTMAPEQAEWIVSYYQRGETRTSSWSTLAYAVEFAIDGEDGWEYAPFRIDGPSGEVLEGSALTLAKLRYAIPEMYGRLEDMPLSRP